MSNVFAALRRLFEPLNLAAYVTWLAVLVASGDPSLGGPGAWRRQAVWLGMLGFLLVFVATTATDKERLAPRHDALLATQALLALSLCVLWPNNAAAPVLTIIVIAECAMRLRAPALIGAGVALNLALWLVFELVWRTSRPWATLLIYVGFQTFAAVTAWYARRARETAAALQQTNAHLLATRSLLEESARDQERLRLARELHDVAGHKLTALKLNLALLQRDCADQARPAIDVVARLAAELLDDVRGVVAQLRQHDGMDLREALVQLAAPLPRPKVHLDIDDGARVDNVAQAEALVRVAQEALTNVARHANADEAWIALRREGGVIHLHVHDDGRGAPQLREGNGLRGMRERLAALGGSLRVSQAPAGGVALDVTLPLN